MGSGTGDGERDDGAGGAGPPLRRGGGDGGSPPGENIVSPPWDHGIMNDQMALLPSPTGDGAASPGRLSWELDEHTRHVGRQGLAAAREALQQAGARRAA